jgi:hypothetical protein
MALGVAFPASVLADAPTADSKPSESTLEDTATQITLSGGDADGDNLTFVIGTSNVGAPQCDNQTPSTCTETVDYTPDANFNSSDSFTYHVNDGTADSGDATVDIAVTAVNDPPSFTKGANQTVLKDSGAQSVTGWVPAMSAGPSDESSQALSFSITGDTVPSLFSVAPAVAADGTLSYTPDADVNGPDSFTYHTNDATADSADATVDIAVTAVNDAPSFTKGANQTVLLDSGAQSVTGWVPAMSAGPSDESGQALSFSITGDTVPSLFSVAPAVAADGTLSYTPAGNTIGTTTVTLRVSDDGGTANGGVDTSPTQTFTITVNNFSAHNDDVSVTEGGAQAVDVLANDNPPPNPQVAMTITSVTQGTHGAVAITGGGTGVTYDPAAGFIGTDSFNYTVHDPGTLSSGATVVVHVSKDVTAPVTGSVIQTFPVGVTMGATMPVRIAWSASDGTGVGIASYQLQQSVDGGAYTTITLPTATTTSSLRGLGVGHSYRFRMRATDKNGNVSAYRNGSLFTALRYQDNSTAVHYGGIWGTSSSTSYSGGTMHYAGTAGKTATLTTTGRDFAIVGPKSQTRGTFEVYVDGVLKATVSETRPTSGVRLVLWSIHFGTSASHQIQIKVVGPARIDLDCFLVLR